jgi:hypothetical protein
MSGVIVAVGAVAAAGIGYAAAQNAANIQANAANNATNLQGSEFATQQANNAPYQAAGVNALGQIQSNMAAWNQPFTMSQFQNSPGYTFALQQGQQALARSQAAGGLGSSGGAQQALASYTTGLANQNYQQAFNNYQTQNQNAYNRLAGVAGIGQSATANTNAAAGSYASNAGNLMTQAGNAQASGVIGGANAIQNGIGTGMNSWMTSQLLNKYGPQQPMPPTSASPGSMTDVDVTGQPLLSGGGGYSF